MQFYRLTLTFALFSASLFGCEKEKDFVPSCAVLPSPKDMPFGIYAVSHINKPVSETTYKNPDLAGVFVRLGWSTLQPQENQFNWSALDNEIAKAASQGKKISFGVAAGKFTPDWVYQKGVPALTFTGYRGNGNDYTVTIPPPYDPLFLITWKNFISELSNHLKSNPANYELISQIKLTGINQDTLEIRLPKQNDAVSKWKANGYTPEKIEETWNTLLAHFKRNFPTKALSYAVIPGGKDFPMVDDDSLTRKFIEDAATVIGEKFVLQSNAIQDDTGTPSLLTARCMSAHLGYQTQLGNESSPSCDSVQNFKNVIDNAIYQGYGHFLEVSPLDVETYPGGVAYGKSQFKTL